MSLCQFIQRSPSLTEITDILSFIFANGTMRWRLIALRELMPTGGANIVLHLRFLCPKLYALMSRICKNMEWQMSQRFSSQARAAKPAGLVKAFFECIPAIPLSYAWVVRDLTPIVTIDRRVRLPLREGRGQESTSVLG